MQVPAHGLTPLIELASHKSLDLFFRVGQGYVARAANDTGFRQVGHGFGASPFGIQSRAEARIVSTLGPLPHDGRLYAWPSGGGTQKRR
ncbi:MAG: hypothetical protein M9945_15750 [Aquamicrobium sp.]|uniref:hypothetical protein n=1 Tax=Aquamicrobium sp. TaxID=1872579 RepID=UPI00349E847C|nr:hypothetical protein [Aquamicrobium sp.]